MKRSSLGAASTQRNGKQVAIPVRWFRLSGQHFGFDKWNSCRVQAAKRMGSGVK
jgi:hypothetical protein